MDTTQAMHSDQIKKEGKEKDPIVKTLLRVFWILLAVTILEIGLALLHFEAGFLSRPVLNTIFIILTIVKAFYIVAEFMHFRHEKKALVLIILVPLFFLLWGIGATIWEGGATLKARQDVEHIIKTPSPWENSVILEK